MQSIILNNKIGIGIYLKKDDIKIAGHTSFMDNQFNNNNNDYNQLILNIDRLNLVPGTYQVEISLAHKGIKRLDYIENLGDLIILENYDICNGERITNAIGNHYLLGKWQVV